MTLDNRQSHRTDASLNELVLQVAQQVSTLMRDELRLAQLEMSAKAKRAGIGAGLFGGVGLFAALGLMCLVAAAVLGLVGPLGTWLAALVVGAALLLLAGIAALVAKRQVQAATPPAPTEALASVKEDVNTIKHARTSGGSA